MSDASLPAPPAALASRAISGFWRRLFAFVLDAIITAIPCGVLGFSFYSFFSTSVTTGTVIGFIISLGYFAVLGSWISEGQTLGQRIVHIAVVDRNGNFISIGRSFVRYLILLTPILISSTILPSAVGSGTKTAIDWALSTAEGAILYLYLFNRPSRQSLHDLATGTYVVDSRTTGSIDTPKFSYGHAVFFGELLLIFVVVSALIRSSPNPSGFFQEGSSVITAVAKSGKVRTVSASLQKDWHGGEVDNTLLITVEWKGKPEPRERAAVEIVDLVLKADPQANNDDFISVVFHEGISIGFANLKNDRIVSHSPADWLQLLREYGYRPFVVSPASDSL